MHKSLWICYLIFFAIWGSSASAKELLKQSAWMEDVSGQMTLPEVQQHPQTFTPYQGVLTKGFSASTFWIRLHIDSTSEEKLILRIRPIYLDHIELFDPLDHSAKNLTDRFSGDHHPKQGNAYKSLNHGFVIQGSPEARDIYLRLQSTSTLLAHVEVMSIEQAMSADRWQELLYPLYLGLLVAFLFWAFLQWLSRRDLLIAVFIIKQFFVLAHALVHQGYLSLLFSEQLSGATLSNITALFVIAYVFSGTAFVLMFLHECKPVSWLWRLFTSIQAIYLPTLVLYFQGDPRLAMQIIIALAALSAFGFVLIAISTLVRQSKTAPNQPLLPSSILIGFTVAQLLVTLLATLPLLNMHATAEWALNAAILPGFVNSLIMTVMLILRARNLEKQHQHLLLEANLLEQKVHSERAQREEQTQFLHMLTHELKTPLTVIRISLDESPVVNLQRQRIDRALANINGIIDRCTFNQRIEHHELRPELHPCKLQDVIDECVQGCSDQSRVKVSERNEAVLDTDSELLAICLANLIDNALKYSYPASLIDVNLLSTPTGQAITVRNVIGQAGTPNPQRLYTKYYRSPGALSKSGSGLGLYLTNNLAKLIGAQVSHRVDGEHVEFRLWLPS